MLSKLRINSSGEVILAVDLNHCCPVWNETSGHLFVLPAAKILDDQSEMYLLFNICRIKQAVGDAFKGRPTVLIDQPFFQIDLAEPFYVGLRGFARGLYSKTNIL